MSSGCSICSNNTRQRLRNPALFLPPPLSPEARCVSTVPRDKVLALSCSVISFWSLMNAPGIRQIKPFLNSFNHHNWDSCTGGPPCRRAAAIQAAGAIYHIRVGEADAIYRIPTHRRHCGAIASPKSGQDAPAFPTRGGMDLPYLADWVGCSAWLAPFA